MTLTPHNPPPPPAYETPGFPPLPEPPSDLPNAQAPANVDDRFTSTRWLCVLLASLTALAAFLRYWRIGYQSYWTDEAWTVSRIHDSFSALLASLSTILTGQGLLPPWYAALRWWCNLVESFTGSAQSAFSPASTRAFAAFFGTLTVPALYYLARQFTDRRGALLVMLLAAVNPFLIYYSRDIKMYAPFYLFVVLNMAYFFRWQSTHRHIAYFPLFVLSGVAMVSLHTMGLFILALQLIFLLTRRGLRPLDGPLWLLGAGISSLFWIYWFTVYLVPGRVINRVTGSVNSGMAWQTKYTDMNWHTIASLPTAHLLGYLWPVNPPDARITDWFSLGDDFKDHLATRSNALIANWEWYAAIGLFAILFLGLFPWRAIGRQGRPLVSMPKDSITRGRWWWIALWIAIPTTALALTWIPHNSPWHARIWGNSDPKSLWEPRYLGIILPAWLLWLASSLRRLPRFPLRLLATAAVAAACLVSSLSNYIIYRNPPFQRAANIAETYIDQDQRATAAMAVPNVEYAEVSENIALTLARHLRPGSTEDKAFVAEKTWAALSSPEEIPPWLVNTSQRPRLKTIILTDRYGDLTDPADPLSSNSLNELLGPQWKLVHEESYRWYYEWRFYIFHTWRTRVWQRTTTVDY